MNRPRLFWRIFPSYLLIVLLGILAMAWWVRREMRQFDTELTVRDLEVRARLFSNLITAQSAEDPARIQELARQTGPGIATRLTVIRRDGLVLADSLFDPVRMENHADREEIKAALGGAVGWTLRHSSTLEEDMIYVAVPYPAHGPLRMVVRTAQPLTSFEATLGAVLDNIGWFVLLLTTVAAILGLGLSRRISRPLEELRRGVEELKNGTGPRKVLVPDTAEAAVLARAINEMTEELDRRLIQVTRQRNEQQAVLAGMREAVLAVDRDERLIFFNPAAEELLGVKAEQAQGRYIQEVVRHADLHAFVRQAADATGSLETDLVWRGDGERYFQARSAILPGPTGDEGVLVVLNEITRLHRLEEVRRDFVANVSHELRTPITAIQGFAETLLAEETLDPERTHRFLGIILRHSTRLSLIIEDLLCLSRVEKQNEERSLTLGPAPLLPIIEAAVQAWAPTAAEKNIPIEMAVSPDLAPDLNPELMERAVSNLVDNAVKYGPPGRPIRIEAGVEGSLVVVAVIDQGRGIAQEHQDRIFERFYRVDRARGRQEGGTGLGLAIVKHVALAHNGTVRVRSRRGEGSTFSIAWPIHAGTAGNKTVIEFDAHPKPGSIPGEPPTTDD